MKGSFKKPAQFMLVLIVAFSMLLTACTSNNNKPTPTNSGTENSGSGNTETGGEAEAPQEFRFTLASEPPSLDPALMTDAQSGIVAAGLYEGLMRLNNQGNPENALTKEMKISDDGKTYTFTLRDDAKWTNGDSVKAADFEYAWKRALNPETASEYAYILYYLENAKEYNTGVITDADQVGVKATGDYTLEVKLHTATSYFPSLLAHYTYLPVHPATVDAAADWATEAKSIVSNGPFVLKQWVHGDKLVLEKNQDYYNKAAINFTNVTISLIEDENTLYQLYETDKVDWIGAQAGVIPTDHVAKLIADGTAKVSDIASTYYYLFNTTKPPFNNAKIRKAFSMSIDRQSMIDNILQAGQKPAYGLVPPSIAGLGDKTFREMFPDAGYFSENAEEAKKLLEEGLAESNLTSFPEVTLLYNTSEGHKKLAEAAADMWRKALGVEVKLANQEWGTFLESRKGGQFDIARSGWGADINHAINFTYDLIHPLSGNNDGKYNNAKVEELLDGALGAPSAEDTLNKLAEAEKIAISDDMGVLPVYYYTAPTLLKSGFENVYSDYSGHLDWIYGKKN